MDNILLNEYLLNGLFIREHLVKVPLDWLQPQQQSIEVFAREIVSAEKQQQQLPYLLFLQGGPGGKAPRPTSSTGWLAQALKEYRVILFDQRGTGRSNRIEGKLLSHLNPKQQADYLACFRADSIIKDAEHLRKHCFGGQQWSTLGQSYGGFLTLSYLSQASEALTCCYITGGLPSIEPDADEVYRLTYQQVAKKNQLLYQNYPHLEKQIAKVADYLAINQVTLPDGDTLSIARLQLLGMELGVSEGAERLLWLFDDAFNTDGKLSDSFLHQVMQATSWIENPLYAVLQELIYAQVGGTNWAAQRLLAQYPEFAIDKRPLYLTGEMFYPWVYDEISALRPFKEAAQLLAQRKQWSKLYDYDKLANNKVPIFAAVYYQDMYVDVKLSLQTINKVANITPWITNEFEHNGLRTGKVFNHLRLMAHQRGIS